MDVGGGGGHICVCCGGGGDRAVVVSAGVASWAPAVVSVVTMAIMFVLLACAVGDGGERSWAMVMLVLLAVSVVMVADISMEDGLGRY